MMKMKEKTTQKSFYIGIKNSNEVRRNILEASKSVIASIQKQQKVQNIQAHKAAVKEKLKNDVKEIKMLFSKLEKILPQNLFETNDINEKKALKEQIKAPLEIKQIPKMSVEEDEVDKLHAHLSIIEARLKNLK